jgi:hypothetical protein
MLRSSHKLLQHVRTANAAQLQQLRFLNVHEYQASIDNATVSMHSIACRGLQWVVRRLQGCADVRLCRVLS